MDYWTPLQISEKWKLKNSNHTVVSETLVDSQFCIRILTNGTSLKVLVKRGNSLWI